MIHLRNPDEATIRLAVTDMLSTVRNRTTLAKALEIRTTLYKWESGESNPSLPMLAKLCQVLGHQLRIDLGPEIEEESVDAKLNRILTRLDEREET